MSTQGEAIAAILNLPTKDFEEAVAVILDAATDKQRLGFWEHLMDSLSTRVLSGREDVL
jgi:hypothetical protein